MSTRRNNNSGREIDVWCGKAASLTKRLLDGAAAFQELATSYGEMRNKTANAKTNGTYNKTKYDNRKDRVDAVYSELCRAKEAFCRLSAGGGARRTRRNK